jgi:hypothetical protein
MAFDLGGATSGAASGAEAGATFGPYGAVIGAVVGGVTGGVLGGKATKARKSAARLLRENAAIERMTNRRLAIVSAIQQAAVTKVAGEGDGYNPEGTSSSIGVQQSIYGQIQANLVTEAMMFNRSKMAASKLSTAQKYDNYMSMFQGAAKGVGATKNALGGTSLQSASSTSLTNSMNSAGVHNPNVSFSSSSLSVFPQ